jgi:flagellum-specific peptidoglycan hydrolase FlgJ
MKSKNKKIVISVSILIGLLLLKKITKKKIKTKIVLTSKQREFVNRITPASKKIGDKIGVPYKFIIAQICLESGFGKSSLTTKYFNYGGIKARPEQPHVVLMTTEYRNGVKVKEPQRFKIFPNEEAGINAQAVVYQNRFFKKYLNKTNDPVVYANLIQSGQPKYATDPNYVSKIVPIINAI